MKTFKWTVLVVTGMFFVVGLCAQVLAGPPTTKKEKPSILEDEGAKPTTETRTPVKCKGRTATIVGTSGNDTIEGTPGDDVIHGLSGRDKIYGRGGNDIICGGNDQDYLHGNDGDDTLYGDAGNDFLYGNAGNDHSHHDA